MYGSLSGGENTQVDNSCPAAFNENKAAVITVAGNKNPFLLMGSAKQFGIYRLRQSDFGCCRNVMPQLSQEVGGAGVHIPGPTHQNLPGFRKNSESAGAVQLKTKKTGT